MALTPAEKDVALRHVRQEMAKFLQHQNQLAAFATFDRDQINGLIRVVLEEWEAGVAEATKIAETEGGFINDEIPW